MSKKNKGYSPYSKLIGAEVVGFHEYNIGIQIDFILKNSKKQSLMVYGEGSYSDWWDIQISYRPNTKIACFQEIDDNDKVKIVFYSETGNAVLTIRGIFHNDSDWDYGCYLQISCDDLKINKCYYI
jgi:hypothetical protein